MSTSTDPSASSNSRADALALRRKDADALLTDLTRIYTECRKSVLFLIPRFETVSIRGKTVILDMGMSTWSPWLPTTGGYERSEYWVVRENKGIKPAPKRGIGNDAPREAPEYAYGLTKVCPRQDKIPGLINRRIEEAKKTKDFVYIVGHDLQKQLGVLNKAFGWEISQGVTLLDTQLIYCLQDGPSPSKLNYALKTVGCGHLVDKLGNSGNDAYCISYLLERLLRRRELMLKELNELKKKPEDMTSAV